MFENTRMFFKLHYELFTGKISFKKYLLRASAKIRQFFFNRNFIRQRFKRRFPIDEVIISRDADCVQPKRFVQKKSPMRRYRYVAKLRSETIGKGGMADMRNWVGINEGEYFMISGVSVDAFRQGLGIGEALYRAMIADAKRLKIKRLYQTITPGNIRNNCLAEKLGFRKLSGEAAKTINRQCRTYAYYMDIE
jgi:GNAT superfamily N-acetyltransferase